MPLIKTTYKVLIEFTSPLLGTETKGGEYFKRKRIMELEKEIKRLQRFLNAKSRSEKEKKAVMEKLEELQEELERLRGTPENTELEELEERMDYFPRYQGKPVLLNYQVLGCLKETARDFFKDIRGAREMITRYFRVEPRHINLFDAEGNIIDEADDIVERSLRTWNPSLQAYITSLKASEAINPPAFAMFDLIVVNSMPKSLHPFDEKNIKKLLKLAGEFKGLLGWRNAGYGRFKVVEFDEMKREGI